MSKSLKPAETYTHTHTHTDSFSFIKKSIFLIIGAIFITQNVIGATINLEFFNENGLTTPSSTKTCTVGQKIGTLPVPSKKGYVFKGWKVFQTCGIPNLDVGKNGTSYGYYKYSGDKGNIATYRITTMGDWATEFSYGTIYGEASCNATIGTYLVKTDAKYTKNTSTPSGDQGNCWCRVTGFTANPNPGASYDYSNGAQCTVSSSAWVFRDGFIGSSAAANCAYDCPFACAFMVRTAPDFREAVFDAVGG